MKINIADANTDIEVGNLVYGAVVTNVAGAPLAVYVKVNKRATGVGIHLSAPEGNSMLLNLKTGALRIIPGDTRVVVLDAELFAERTQNVSLHIKRKYLENGDCK